MSQQLSSGCRRVWAAVKRGPARLLTKGHAALSRTPFHQNDARTSKEGFRARPGFAELEDAFTLLEQSRPQLEGISSDVEARFLAITSVLESLPTASEQLVKQSERLLALASGKDHGATVFQSTLDLLKAPLEFIEHSQVRNVELIALLQQVIAQIDRMLSYEAILEKTVAPLKFIQTLFKVESAGLSHSVQQMFLALTEDIERLQQQVSETFFSKFEILRSSRKIIDTVMVRLKDAARTQNAAAKEKKNGIQQALADLQADLKKNEERDIQLTAVSRVIDQQVGRMVFSLQAQDIVSQKVAHVLQVVQMLQQRFGELRDSNDVAVANASAVYCRDASAVQAAQLQAAGQDLNGASEEIASAARTIRDQITKLDEECLCLKEFDKVTAGVDGLVQVLLDTIADVRAIVTDAATIAEQSYVAIRPIGSLTSNVTVTMRQLSAHIRLIALNAQVQAAHIGSGTGLEVLAAGTATIAAETTEISENVARELDALTVDLGAHVKAFENLHQRGVAQQEELATSGKEKEASLHSFRDETLSALTQVGAAVETIERLADSMGQKLDFQSVIDTCIKDGREALDSIVFASKQWLESGGLTLVTQASASDLARSYTMASEREVHDAVLLGRDKADSGISVSNGTGPAAAPEFFDDFSATPNASTTPQKPEPGVLPATAAPIPSAKAETARPVAPAKDLGDNVDLF